MAEAGGETRTSSIQRRGLKTRRMRRFECFGFRMALSMLPDRTFKVAVGFAARDPNAQCWNNFQASGNRDQSVAQMPGL